LISGCVSSRICLWDIEKSAILCKIDNAPLNNEQDSLNSINSLKFSTYDYNLFASGTRDGLLRIYDIREDLNSMKPVFSILAHGNFKSPSKMNNCEFSMDGVRILTSGRDSKIKIWDLRTLPNSNITEEDFKKSQDSIIQQFNEHKCQSYNVQTTFYNNELQILTGSEDFKAYIYDIKENKCIKKLQGFNSVVHLVCSKDTSSDSLKIASTSIDSNGIHVFKPNIGNEKKKEFLEEPRNEEPAQREFVEVLVEKYGDKILKLFHKYNLTFSNGCLESVLQNIMQNMTSGNDSTSQLNGIDHEMNELLKLILKETEENEEEVEEIVFE